MADDDELEPLFDYRRVQPRDFILLDDDASDTSPYPSQKRKKNRPNSQSVGEEDSDDDVKVLETVNCKDKDEEDWLPPPPKVSTDFQTRAAEDSTIKALRYYVVIILLFSDVVFICGVSDTIYWDGKPVKRKINWFLCNP
ncbi:Ubiquitin-like superfamily protein [Euphorbia peplus]|nr:Ubiquitin-like superfamily protein [Euphorbia peplus]